jgi:membrane-associated phospholipid phosphatase
MEMPFPEEQLELVSKVVCSRTEWLDPLFIFLNYFDSAYFIFVLIPFIWIGFSYRLGLKLFYTLAFSGFLNTCLKVLIGWPRPTHDCPDIGLFDFHSYGFPSGGAQTAALLGTLLIYYWKSKWRFLVGGVYILLVSFSRIYLGAHYPLDVLGGWVLGFLLAFLFIHYQEKIEKYLTKKGLNFCLALNTAVALFFLWLIPMGQIQFQMGSLLAIGLGAYFSFKYDLCLKAPKTITAGTARGTFAVAILFLIYFLWPREAPLFTQSFVIGLWVSLFASPVCKSLRRSP